MGDQGGADKASEDEFPLPYEGLPCDESDGCSEYDQLEADAAQAGNRILQALLSAVKLRPSLPGSLDILVRAKKRIDTKVDFDLAEVGTQSAGIQSRHLGKQDS